MLSNLTAANCIPIVFHQPIGETLATLGKVSQVQAGGWGEGKGGKPVPIKIYNAHSFNPEHPCEVGAILFDHPFTTPTSLSSCWIPQVKPSLLLLVATPIPTLRDQPAPTLTPHTPALAPGPVIPGSSDQAELLPQLRACAQAVCSA